MSYRRTPAINLILKERNRKRTKSTRGLLISWNPETRSLQICLIHQQPHSWIKPTTRRYQIRNRSRSIPRQPMKVCNFTRCKFLNLQPWPGSPVRQMRRPSLPNYRTLLKRSLSPNPLHTSRPHSPGAQCVAAWNQWFSSSVAPPVTLSKCIYSEDSPFSWLPHPQLF